MDEAKNLIGSWESDVRDHPTTTSVGRVRMEFYPDGILAYVTFENERAQIMKLTYRIAGNTIVTDQPSSPGTETTRFELSGQTLKLLYNSTWISFRKVS